MLHDSLRQLLLNEQEEINEWNRAVAQIYYAWYTVFLTLNGVALTWVFGDKPPENHRPDLKYAIVVFALWNLLGIIATIAVACYVRSSNTRVQKINDLLTDRIGDASVRVKSPMPALTSQIAYCANVVALASLLIVWIILFRR
jgi:hypothetical protein